VIASLVVAAVIGCSSAFIPPSGFPTPSVQNVVVGPLWFTGLRGYELALPAPGRGPDGWYFAKTPTALRKGHTVKLQIDPGDVGWARFDYTGAERARAVTFRSCVGQSAGAWTGWAGGFAVTRAGCVRFTASIDGMRPRRYRVGVGVLCA
jgi:hypothetical protein